MKNTKYVILGLLILIVTITHMSCSIKEAENKKNDGKIKITATIGMIADIAKQVGGENVEVEVLMDAGVDPHLYRASAGDIEKLQKADLIFYNGLHLEAKMGDVLKKISNERKTVAVAENIPAEYLLPFEDSEFDPHVWFDVKLWKYALESIYKNLSDFAPDKKNDFEKKYNDYITQLDALDMFIKNRISEIPQEKRVLVTAHDAFNYFSKAYGFEVRGLQGISTVSEAGAKDVQELADFITKRKLSAIFIESSVPEKNVKALQAAVKSRGYDVAIGGELFSDAMGDEGTFEGTYIGMLTHNINTIIDALK